MDRGKPNSLIVRNDRLGAVAVMAIKIPNGNPFDLWRSGGGCPP